MCLRESTRCKSIYRRVVFAVSDHLKWGDSILVSDLGCYDYIGFSMLIHYN